MEKRKCPYMFALFLLAKQSKDLRTVQVLKDRRRKVLEEWCCWEKVLGLNISFPSQGNQHDFRCPWRESLHHRWCLKTEIPSASGHRMGTIIQVLGNKLFIPSHFHSWCCLLCLSPSTGEGDPAGHLCQVKAAQDKTSQVPKDRSSRLMSKARGDARCSGGFHLMGALPGDKYWQGFLFVSTRVWGKRATFAEFCNPWAKWPENLTNSYWLALSTCFEKRKALRS